MKQFKFNKIIFLITVLLSTNFYAQNTYVPDDVFEAYLETHDASGNIVAVGSSLSMGNGVSNDNYVTTSSINTVIELHVDNLGINDLTGIEDFTALEILYCHDNNLTSLPVSQNTNLKRLYCQNNSISTLNVDNCTNLEIFQCGSNSLSSLNVSNNLKLTNLSCDYNQISSLDVSLNDKLETIDCHLNAISKLDLSKNTLLTSIDCASNNLTELNIKNGKNPTQYFGAAGQGGTLTCIQVSDPAYYNANWSSNIDSSSSFNVNCHYDEVYVPDNIFETYLETHDSNGNSVAVGSSNSLGNGISNDDYVASPSILSSVTSLTIDNLGIQDLTGIKSFTALQNLHCSNNNLSTIDVSENTQLILLDCSHNQLSSLYISFLTSLETLICNNNSITSITATENTQLKTLLCNDNHLVNFDLRNGNNTILTNFNAINNQVTCINVSDVTYATNNWTNIDAGVSFSLNCAALGLEDHTPLNFKMYPNPVLSDEINIQLKEDANVIIYTIEGKKIFQKQFSVGKHKINHLQLAKGIYLANVISKNKKGVKKLIVE